MGAVDMTNVPDEPVSRLNERSIVSTVAHILRHEESPLRSLFWRLIHRTGLGSLLVIQRELYRLHFFPTNYSKMAWFDKGVGKEDELFLRQVLKTGDIVVDVGANIGLISLAAASLVGDTGRVVCIEPNPRTFRYLRKNVELNRFSHCTTFNCAVGEQSGTTLISNGRFDDINRIVAEDGVSVPLVTLDEILSEISGRIRLLKIDVEGYELYVLKGAVNSLEVFEDNFARFGYRTADLLALVRDSGFDVLFTFSANGLRREPIHDKEFCPRECMNIVATKRALT
jgi:FkbM family methyltransferase